MPFLTQLYWLSHKIVTAKLRKPQVWMSATELFLMAEFALILVPLSSLRADTSSPFSSSPLPRALPWTRLANDHLCLTPNSVVLFAPDAPATRRVATHAVALLRTEQAPSSSRSVFTSADAASTATPAATADGVGDAQNATSAATPAASPAASEVHACAVRGFSSTGAMLSAFAATRTLHASVAAAIVFNDGDSANASAIGSYTLALARSTYAWGQHTALPGSLTEVRTAYLGYNDRDSFWTSSGFVSFQWAVDAAVAAETARTPVSETVRVARFPLQPFSSAYGPESAPLEYMLPIYACLSSTFIATYLITLMNNEKAYGLVSGLRMMGMPYSAYHLSWWLVYGCIVSVAATVQTAAFATLDMFPHSSYALLALTLELHGLAAVAFGSVVVAAVRVKANDPESGKKVAPAVGFFLPLVAYVAYVAVVAASAPRALFSALCLSSHVAGPAGVLRFVEAERSGGGLSWAQLADAGTGPSLALVWLCLVGDVLLYVLLATWLARRGVARTRMPRTQQPHPRRAVVEAVSDALHASVLMRNLGRAFAAKPPVVALANVDLTLYDGQVTALLGQNGAGKTTAIGILTGLFPPSEGSASVYGRSCASDGEAVRRMCGVCAQQDLAFACLSALESVRLAGAIKGMRPAELLSDNLARVLENVGLEAEAWHRRTETLSGGQKRKLSLACALVGSPRLLLLDEPTAGMDPRSRRVAWGAAAAAKAGRTVVLTTHFLDEADALGDRVAILHGGRLQCAGSAAFLKAQFGTSYQLTLTRSPSQSLLLLDLLALLTKHVALTKLEVETPAEVRYSLPQHDKDKFAPLFADLDERLEDLGVGDYGLSVPTLHEVFLRITAAADEAAAADDEAAAAAAEGIATAKTAQPTDAECAVELVSGIGSDPVAAATATDIGVDEASSARLHLCVGAASDAEGGCAGTGAASQPVQMRRVESAAAPARLLPSREQRARLCAASDCACIEACEASSAAIGDTTVQTSVPDVACTSRDGASLARQLRMGMQLQWHAFTQEGTCFVFLAPLLVISLCFLLPPLLDTASDPTGSAAAVASLQTMDISATAFGVRLSHTLLPFSAPAGDVQTQLASTLFASDFGYTPAPKSSAAQLAAAISAADSSAAAAYLLSSNNSVTQPATIYHNPIWESSLPVFLNLLNSARLRAAGSSTSLHTRAALLPYVGEAQATLPSYVGALLAPPVVGYVFTFIGLVVVSQLVKDRLVDKVTHSQLVMGLSPAIRWTYAAIWWCVIMHVYLLFGAVLYMLVFPDYVPGREGVPAFVAVCVCSVPPLFLFLCLFNFIFWCRSNVEDVVAQVFCNALALVTVLPSVLLSAVPELSDTGAAKSAAVYLLLLVPYNQLVFGLAAVYKIGTISKYEEAYSASGDGKSVSDFFVLTIESPVDGESSPGPLSCMLFSLLTLPLWFAALWFVDVRRYYHATPVVSLPARASGTAPSFTPGRAAGAGTTTTHQGALQAGQCEAGQCEDADVAAERRRAEGGGADAASVRLLRLHKSFAVPRAYGKRQPPKVAVADLSLGVDSGCFALLGPNGAGKTTTLAMLTGDVAPTSGCAWICGLSVQTQALRVFKLLGYCPQSGGLYPRGITLRQHLEAYGRLKDVPERDLPTHVSRLVSGFGLERHQNKFVSALSGGTKRKLAAAIAFSSEPRVCFLDEPTTGVDVGTRIFLWKRIKLQASAGCTMVLTTHNMEEADALAQRVGIMVNGQLQALGSPQHLKSVHGGGYRIELKGPAATAAAASRLVQALFESAELIEAHGGLQVFEARAQNGVQRRALRLGAVFSALEAAKSDAAIALENYTLSQTTLEQVFLNIAAAQIDESTA